MSEILIRTAKLKKIFHLAAEQVAAVDGVDLLVNKGDFVALLGPSGSGKTTLLDMLGCLDQPTSGILEVLGTKVTGLPEHELVNLRRGRIGFVFQDFSLVPTLTARENLLLAARLSRRTTNGKKIDKALAMVGLAGRGSHLPRQLSGGEKQRVAIARALLIEPEILIADEPTGQLDSENSRMIFALLQQLNHDQILTVIVATHDLALGELAGQRMFLRDGRIIKR
ncbi:MAG: ABC transporter ATP-binding protein [Deltaproteobacteria bacterium]|nr:ABC transporter ATP-binding protein [Candidatus Anaeroferrophillus wilburensis]MBN2890050.1 ABC transporter ATP-binding protein [Deltaproteobacteria bacterium]